MFWSIERLYNTNALVGPHPGNKKEQEMSSTSEPDPQSNPAGPEWLGCLMLASEFPEIVTSCPCPTPITRAISPLAEQTSHLQTKHWGQACSPDALWGLHQHLLPDQGFSCPLPVLKVNLNKHGSKLFSFISELFEKWWKPSRSAKTCLSLKELTWSSVE